MSPSTPTSDARLIRQGPDRADHRLVLLHGWGADAEDLLDLGALLVGSDVSVVALEAPLQHPCGQGRQWYDLQEPGWPQLPMALQSLGKRLESLAEEIPPQDTVVLGFSQGAAMIIDWATRPDGLPLGGVVACSGYPHPDWTPEASGGCGCQQFLLTHGKQDPVVPFEASEELRRKLDHGGHGVELHQFEGGHTIDTTMVEPIRNFLGGIWHRA